MFQSNPAKVFVGICTAFLVVWCALQFVASLRLEEEARMCAQGIFSWAWMAENNLAGKENSVQLAPFCEAGFEPDQVIVKKRNQSDALVVVKGKQHFVSRNKEQSRDSDQAEDCSVTLSFYKHNNHWILGRVEME